METDWTCKNKLGLIIA